MITVRTGKYTEREKEELETLFEYLKWAVCDYCDFKHGYNRTILCNSCPYSHIKYDLCRVKSPKKE